MKAHDSALLSRCMQVASRLWELLVVKAGLMQHLSAIKDYFLLSKGDFYQCFLNDAARLLAGPVNKATATSDLGECTVGCVLGMPVHHDPCQ